VLKANMRIVGNTEYALLFYRDKLPKYNNGGRTISNSMPMLKDNITPKIHPTQKPLHILKFLIHTFTDVGDVVIDPCAGSGTTLLAANQLNRRAYGFEIKKEFVKGFNEILNKSVQKDLFSQ
jgi:site-specific DNA-methyltransferase (adenine-specific)